ncbi:hypothetical protein BHE74_00043221 [Ensete ventricosum]|nr:hypothetical protein BHE74_00043221 [Ensete ventricosum]
MGPVPIPTICRYTGTDRFAVSVRTGIPSSPRYGTMPQYRVVRIGILLGAYWSARLPRYALCVPSDTGTVVIKIISIHRYGLKC